MPYSVETIFYTIEAIAMNGSFVQKLDSQSLRAQYAFEWVDEREKRDSYLYDGQHTGNPHSFIITVRDESELVKM